MGWPKDGCGRLREVAINPIQAGLFWDLFKRAGVEESASHDVHYIKEMTMKLKKYIVRQKVYLLIYVMWGDDVS